MLKKQYERTGSEAMDGDAFPWRVLAGCVPSPPFPSWASLLHPSAPSLGQGAGWGQAARSSGPTELAASRWLCRGMVKRFLHRFIPDSVCCYDLSGIGSRGYVTVKNTCAFCSQIGRCISKSCS